MGSGLPLGKLPPDLLQELLSKAPRGDPRVLIGPGIGLDCAVIEHGDTCLVYKSDPITFATEDIGWYAVQVNANDIATCGAVPRWMLVTLLLPETKTTPDLAEKILEQVFRACAQIEVTVIGGHTEVTYALERPILVGTMIGEVRRESLITPRGAIPGDHVLLTKGVPVEATSILAREFAERLVGVLSPEEIRQAAHYLYEPGIGVLREARLAIEAGQVTAMHDPTEGGLVAALWEMAQASGRSLWVDLEKVPIPPLARRACQALGVDPLRAIASGALLLTAPPDEALKIQRALEFAGISCADIGEVREGPAQVWERREGRLLTPPPRDEIARLFEAGTG